MGVAFPSPIRSYIDANVIDKRYPAYLQVNAEGSLIDWGGALQHYGIDDLQPGLDVAAQLPFLTGLLPVDEQGLALPWIDMGSECFADVHLLGFGQDTWIILLDATAEATQHCVMQQKINNINLHVETTERSLEQLCVLQEPSWQGICIHQNFIIQWVNSAFANMLGVDDTDVWVGRDLRSLIAEEARGRLESDTILDGNALPDGIWPGQRTDGQPYWMKVQSIEQAWRGQPAVLMMSLDITEQKKLEAQLQQAQIMSDLAISADGLAHDLRNVFTTILGCSELALYCALPNDVLRQNLRQLQTASQQAWDLVQHVLALSQQGTETETAALCLPQIDQ